MTVRLAEAAAIAAIGDGVVGILFPARHAARWQRGPSPWRCAVRPFLDDPALTRTAGVA